MNVTSHHSHNQLLDVNLFCFSVKCVGPVRKPIHRVFKPFVQDYKPFPLTVLPVCFVPVSIPHSSLYQPAVTYVPYVSPLGIPAATFFFPHTKHLLD